VSYKVKTTAPKRYIVRPNTGIIESNQHVEIQITLTATKEKTLDLRARDKFLVQILCLTEEQAATVDLKDLWIAAKDDEIIKHRLKAYFSKPPTSSSNPYFTPTIPSSSSSEHLNIVEETATEVELEASAGGSKSFLPKETATEENYQEQSQTESTEEIIQLRSENKRLSKSLANNITEKDELKNQLIQLKSKLAVLDKEATLRQRRSFQEQTTPKVQTVTVKQANPHILTNHWLHLLLVAILFFYLGKTL